ncbi:MAG: hypothetical protein L3J84_13045 [Gammaproteobacteria bacterium]|nr:hypothetical protein [Gammaproteobacteria bacterium]
MNKWTRYLIAVLLSPILLPIALVYKYEDQVNKTTWVIFSFIKEVQELWEIIVIIFHALGRILTVSLLIMSSATFLFVLLKESGVTIDWFYSFYLVIERIVKNPVSWATGTTIVATTVAIGHMKNLEINQKKHAREEYERSKKEKDITNR